MMPGPRLYSPFDETMWESVAEGGMRIQRCDECCFTCAAKSTATVEIGP